MPRMDAAVGDESRSAAEAAAAAPPRPHCRPPLVLRKQLQHEGREEEEENYRIASHSALVSQTVSHSLLGLSLSVCLIGAFLQFSATRKEESVPSAKGSCPTEERTAPNTKLSQESRAGRGRLPNGIQRMEMIRPQSLFSNLGTNGEISLRNRNERHGERAF